MAAVEREFERGERSTLLVLPTGCGKTVAFAELARREIARGGRVLVLAHRTELLDQARDKLTEVGVWAAIEQADKRAGFAPVVVASVQTLQRKRLAAFGPSTFTLVVVDEAHHAPAASYRAVLEYFATARILGVTATPDRGDGVALGEMFTSVAYRYELREAIADGWLVPIRARRIVVEGVDLSSVRSRAGDLAQDQLAAVMASEEAVHGVVGPLLEQTGARRTIVFGVDVAHSLALAEVLNRHRLGCARAAHGEMGALERKELLAAFRRGEFQYLINCALFTEGFDEPAIECVATVRPTKSRALFVQMVGRGTRLLGRTYAASCANGKRDLLLLDFTGNAGKHKLAGPIDALAAGAVSDELRAEADRLLEADALDVDETLDAAALELERCRAAAKVTANAQYFAREIDPFLGAELGEPILAAWAAELATSAERDQLAHLGHTKLPAELTRGEVARIVSAHGARARLGLASLKQARLLERYGIDARRMPKAAASARIGALVRAEWDPSRARHALAAIAAAELVRAGRPPGGGR